MRSTFYSLGRRCARTPVRIWFLCLLSSILFCCGIQKMHIQNDPQKLWVPPQSLTAQQQEIFNQAFDPFYRIEQLIFYFPSSSSSKSMNTDWKNNSQKDLIEEKFLFFMASIQMEITQTRWFSTKWNQTLSLENFCYRPIKEKGCLVTSPFQYWQSNMTLLKSDPDLKMTTACQTTHPILKQRAACMDQNGIPVIRNVVFGGLSNDSCHANPDPCGESTPKAQALIVTFLVKNHESNATYDAMVTEWEEKVFLKIAQKYQIFLDDKDKGSKYEGMKLTFMAQRSISDALAIQTKQNAFIVVISYICMFIYVSMALGHWKDPVHSRFGLGLTGLCIVLFSLGISLGICCAFFQMEVTMITLEVVPFLILAIGVDNMFILTNEFDRLKLLRTNYGRGRSNSWNNRFEDEQVQEILGETMANVGPSILVAAISEALAFLVGVFTKIPALTTFCIVAAVAVLVDFLLQITWFSAALVLDARRVRARRLDLFPWLKQKYVLSPQKLDMMTKSSSLTSVTAEKAHERLTSWDPPTISSHISLPPLTPTTSLRRSISSEKVLVAAAAAGHTGLVKRFIETKYSPFLFKTPVRISVLLCSGLLMGLSTIGFAKLPLGLEQSLAVPTDFYLHEYFLTQTKYGEAGPLAYVVIDHVKYTDPKVQIELNRLLDRMSLLQEYIQTPIYSWLNTFNQWRQLRFFLQEKIKQKQCDCPLQPLAPFAYETTMTSSNSNSMEITPDEMFYPLVKNFTQISIESSCCQHYGLCGAQYENDIVFKYSRKQQEEARIKIWDPFLMSDPTKKSDVVVGSKIDVPIDIEMSRMRFQVNTLRNQSVFINSFYYLSTFTAKWSQTIPTTSTSSKKKRQVAFPYSLYFVYYDQYTYIQGIAIQSILLALGVVFVALYCMMDFRMSLLVTLSVFCMTFSQIGFLFVWNCLSDQQTSINAVSVVNLLTSVGLGVEFCVHMAHKFLFSKQNRLGVTSLDHAQNAMSSVGASIVSGITLTKFCGIGVLAFAPSMLFRVYFFRMYFGIVLLGFFYGMVFFPVVLSWIGTKNPPKKDPTSFLLSEEMDSE